MDSQLKGFKCNQRQKELDNIDDSIMKLEESYLKRINVLDEPQNKLKDEFKDLSLAKGKDRFS